MSCIVLYKGKKYDVAKFLNEHPGGDSIILQLKDKDITDAYTNIGHSKNADKILAKYIITENVNNQETDNPISVQPENLHKLDLKFTTKKLFTHEDVFNIHKILGFLALIHFIYRYFYVLPTTNTLGFGRNYLFDTCCLALHLALSYSSIIFNVLKHRIPERPLIIYQEYRLHAMVFTTRAVLVSLFGMYNYLIPTEYHYYILTLLILSISIIVDLITYKFGTPGITAVRNNNDSSIKPLRLAYAYYQFIAMGSHLLLNPKMCDLGFNGIIAIQSSAFLMTLKRKSIIRWYSHAFWYTFALILSSYYIWYVKNTSFMVYILCLFIIRVKFNVSKYIIWSIYLFCNTPYFASLHP